MKKICLHVRVILLIFAFVFSFSAIASASVSLSAFQEPVIRDYLRQFDNGWYVGGDRWVGGHDDILSNIEIAQINAFAIRGAGLRSLQGIEYLTALTELQCPHNQVNELDLSKNTTLQWVWCEDNPLTSLNVSGLGALWYLNCRYTQLTSLDVSGLTALRELHLGYTSLKDINLSGCTSLMQLYCDSSKLTSLNLSGLTALTILDCSKSQLTKLDVTGRTALNTLFCYDNNLAKLDVTGCTALNTLFCHNNNLAKLDVTGCTALEKLKCDNNQLEELNVSNKTALFHLYCSGNHLKTLDLSEDKALRELNFHDNELMEIYLTNNTALKELICYNNHLTELDLSKNTKLTCVICSPQTREGMKVKITNKGYEVDLSEYVTKLENVVWDSIRFGEKIPISFDAGSGIVVFSECPSEVFYCYNTRSPNETYMEVTIKTEGGAMKVEALERGHLGTDSVPDADNIICDMTSSYYIDNQGQKLTEATIAGYDYGTYGKLGFTADGNSRLIIRIQTDKPGYANISLNDDISATFESLNRTVLSPTSQLRAWETGELGYQVSAVLIAPETFPADKNFPSDTFKVHVKFYADDGTTAEKDLELTIEAAPVILIPGLFGSERTFGFGGNKGVWRELKRYGFNVDFLKYNSLQGVNKNNVNAERLRSKLWSKFNEYSARKIVCTRADIVGFGIGGLIAEAFCKIDPSEDDGNNWSTISYKQGMVRRLIAIATPHHGTPWADILVGVGEQPPFSHIGETWDYVYKHLMDDVTLNSEIQSVLHELMTTRTFDEMPYDVPIHAIYGDVRGTHGNIQRLLSGMNKGISDILNLATFKKNIRITIILILLNHADDILNYVDNYVFVANQKHDRIVSYPSAIGDITNAISGFSGKWEYRHATICKQPDVATRVVDLLQGSLRNFEVMTTFDSQATTVPAKEQAVSGISKASSETTKDFNFIEAIGLNISPTVLTVTDSATQSAMFTITADASMHEDIYCVINNGYESGIFVIPSADITEGKFEVNLEFTSQDTGAMNVFCFSHNPNDTDGTSLLISNTAQITVVQDLADVNITGIDFAGNQIYTNVNSETPAGLYAIADDENYYDISSPLAGTEWTADDPDIAIVNDEGRVQGLKEGTTTLRAEFNGLTAAISVDVGPAYEDSDDEPEPEPQPQPTPDNHTSRNSGGGCNSSSLGICALLLLFKKKR